jgi:hypothetical protein
MKSMIASPRSQWIYAGTAGAFPLSERCVGSCFGGATVLNQPPPRSSARLVGYGFQIDNGLRIAFNVSSKQDLVSSLSMRRFRSSSSVKTLPNLLISRWCRQ